VQIQHSFADVRRVLACPWADLARRRLGKTSTADAFKCVDDYGRTSNISVHAGNERKYFSYESADQE